MVPPSIPHLFLPLALLTGPPEAEFGYSVLQHVGGGQRWMLVGAPWDGPSGDRRGDVYRCPIGGLRSATCTKGHLGCPTYMDVVIVLDGSNSIYPWSEVQTFLRRLVGRLFIDPEQIQWTGTVRGEPCARVVPGRLPDEGRSRESSEEPQSEGGARNENRPSNKAGMVTEGFSQSRGGRPEAARLLVVVTDGESHDGEDLPAALKACEAGRVTRYGIAVLGHYLRRQRDPSSFLREIRAIASDPDERFFFNVTDEAALTDIVDALGDRIFGLEGDGILFGMVGAYDWGGSVLWLEEGRRLFPPPTALEDEFPPALQNHAAYLGYSVSSMLLPGGRRLFLSGAPRFKHRGKVIAFQLKKDGVVRVAQSLQGDQIGAYFGSELCPLDTDMDGITDILLVAAPMFLGPQNKETGRVYVYMVGQRIAAVSMPRALRYFGRSVDGRLDLDGDDLVDVAVGAHGAAVLLSSQPIIHLVPALDVMPPHISVVQKDCKRRGQEAACLTADLCFRVLSQTPGRWDRRFHIRFSASLDEWTTGARAAFDGSGQRLSPRQLQLSVGNVTCEQLHFHALDTSDYLRPVALTVTFALDNTTKPGPVLAEGSSTSIQKLIPFSKDCGPDNECTTDLVLQANMDIRGSRKSPFVVQGGRQKVLVSATLENKKENAYNTSLSLSFSRNLHLASLSPQRAKSVKVECAVPSPHARLCTVGHPVFQAGAKVSFLLEFEFSCASLLSQVVVRLTASSSSVERSETLQDNTAQTSAYVRYEPHLMFSSESTLHRYEVHPYRTLPVAPGPEFKTTLRVQNLGCHASCAVRNLTEPPGSPVHPEELWHTNRLMGATLGVRWWCHLGLLAKGTEVSVGLLRLVHNEFFRRAKFKSVTVVSTFQLGTEEGSVLLLNEAARRSESHLEVIQTLPTLVSLWILLGSVLGGLLLLALLVFCLWKLGFFTRKKIPKAEQSEEKLEQ
ncbi:Integrin, alpha 10 [Apodemus speciosus]|uniref:Integrin, alpha 10 n=1 Tax=Apodemus speciosus TaxID=105296 RepID=A0ABQ0ELB7_APOSI